MTARMLLRLPAGFEWQPLVNWVNRLGDDWVNRTEGEVFTRLFTVGNRRILVRCAPKSERLVIRMTTLDGQPPTAEARAEIRRVIRHMFSLDLDWPTIRQHLASDSVLGSHIKDIPEFRPFRAASLFEALIDSIVGQQVSVSFATTLRNRLVEEFGASMSFEGETYYAFPTPSRMSRASVSLLRDMQLSQRKAEYILGVAARFERPYPLNGCDESDVARLTRLRGIGPWSAEYALMQGGGALDLVPAGDVGLQAKLHHLCGLNARPDDAAVRELAAPWHPYRSVAAYFIWYAIRSADFAVP